MPRRESGIWQQTLNRRAFANVGNYVKLYWVDVKWPETLCLPVWALS